jgi:hypothetical protein
LAESKRNKLGDTDTGKRSEESYEALPDIENETHGINPDFLLMNLKQTNSTITV